MSRKARRVMVLGVDGPIAPRLYHFAEQGYLPTLRTLIERGVYAPNCLAPFPTITPPNWTTIATGAWAGTHGIADFDNRNPGQGLKDAHQAFDSREVRAESIWEAAERVGKRAIVVNYPTSWPSKLKNGHQIAGFGTNVNDWHFGQGSIATGSRSNLARGFLLSTEAYPFVHELTFRKAKDWVGVETGPKAMEAEVKVTFSNTLHTVHPVGWYLLLDDTSGSGYDQVTVAREKKADGVVARLTRGEWSANLYGAFGTNDGDKTAVYKLKVTELSADGSQFSLYCPGLFSLTGWGSPESIEREIAECDGLPLDRGPWEDFRKGWIDGQTLVEVMDFNHTWLAEASVYLLTNKPWDVFYLHVHTPDHLYHTMSLEIDPVTATDPRARTQHEAIELDIYQGVDRCLGRILQAADEETLVIVTSDHGGKVYGNNWRIDDVLAGAGLLTYKSTDQDPSQYPWHSSPPIDWEHTKAAGHCTVHVFLNVKGRDAQGIVAPGEEYTQVQEQVIRALHEYTDPKTGRKPVSLALKREDARILGLYSDHVGDVIYALDPRFGTEHAWHLPTARYGMGDLRALLIMAGPGVRRGEIIDRTVWLTDIVPTICHLCEMPVPKQCEGAIVYQALEDPDAQTKELQSLRSQARSPQTQLRTLSS